MVKKQMNICILYGTQMFGRIRGKVLDKISFLRRFLISQCISPGLSHTAAVDDAFPKPQLLSHILDNK